MPGPLHATTRFPVPLDLNLPALKIGDTRTRPDGKSIAQFAAPTAWTYKLPHLELLWQRYLPAHDLPDDDGRSLAGVDFSAMVGQDVRISETPKQWHGYGVVDWYCRSANRQAAGLKDLLLVLHRQRTQALKALGDCTAPHYEVTHALTVGMGLPSTIENSGVAFERTYGFPILPGKSLKGLLRHYLHDETGEAAPEAIKATAVLGAACSDDDLRSVLQAVSFGSDKKESAGRDVGETTLGRLLDFLCGTTDSEGAVAFHDGWIRPEPSEWFSSGVLTPHHNDYLSDTLKEPHLDRESPVPTHFLILQRGVRFVIPLGLTKRGRHGNADARAALLRLTRHFLDRALDEWGIGGRSGASFGRLVRHPAGAPGAGQ